MRLNETRLRVLRALQQRFGSHKDVSYRAGVSESTVAKATKELVDAGMITIRAVVSDPEDMGLRTGELRLRVASPQIAAELERRVAEMQQVTDCVITNDNQYCIRFHARSNDMLGELVKEIAWVRGIEIVNFAIFLKWTKRTTELPLGHLFANLY